MVPVQPIYCKAAVAWEPSEPLKIETVEVDVPKQGEVRIKVSFCGIGSVDNGTQEAQSGTFMAKVLADKLGTTKLLADQILSAFLGDHVIPLYIPQCKDCKFCKHPRTNLCSKIRNTQGRGLMPDGTTRFTCQGRKVFHFMGVSTFSEYTVVAEISLCKINPAAPLDKVCLLGCAVSTGYGAALNIVRLTKDTKVGIWGLGAVGLAVAMGARERGCKTIIGIDINSHKFPKGNDASTVKDIHSSRPGSLRTLALVERRNAEAASYFLCPLQRAALESCHKGWGESVILGVAGSGQEISTRPFQLVTGRVWRGCAFGGWKSVDQVPQLVDLYMKQRIQLDDFVTHKLPLEKINDAFTLMQSGLW
ncbi:unnamed protein product [Ixodes hexagonus]